MYERNQVISPFTLFRKEKKMFPPFLTTQEPALKYGIKALNIEQGSEVLIPDFICDSVLHPFNDLNIQPVFYTIKQDMTPDWIKLKKAVNKKTRTLLFTHYFRIPQQIEKFIDFSKQNNIRLIEDNAHSFPGKYKGKTLGTFGDIGIISIRKTLPVYDGGWLYLKDDYKITIPDLPTQRINYKSIIKILCKLMIKKNQFLKSTLLKPEPYSNMDGFYAPKIPEYSMHKSSYYYLKKINTDSIVKRRQAIYKIWKKWTHQNGLEPIFSQPLTEESPLVFPCYAADESIRNKWFDWGYQNNICVHSWPQLPKEVQDKSKYNAPVIWQKLICFPINQGMNPKKPKPYLEKIGGVDV